MSLQYGELGPAAEKNGWQVSGTPANFNGFRVLASLLHDPYTAVFTTRSGVHGRVHLNGTYRVFNRELDTILMRVLELL